MKTAANNTAFGSLEVEIVFDTAPGTWRYDFENNGILFKFSAKQ